MDTHNLHIPYLPFEPKNEGVDGIDVLSINDLKRRKEQFDHDPESAHLVSFHILICYTKGRSKHLVDFVWHEVEPGTLLYLSKGQVNAFSFTEELEGYILLFTEEYFTTQ